MKKILLFLMAILPLFAVAKDNKDDDKSNPKYLAGAITMEDGNIVFSKSIDVPSLNQKELYSNMLKWANERFKPEDQMNSKVVYTDEEKGEIVATAEEYIVFSSSALSLDRTRIYYHFLIEAKDGKCNLSMSRIRYWYDENRDGGERYSAEEWITDDIALNKKKTKLAPICGKFRRETINLKDELFQSVESLLGQHILQNNTASNINSNNDNVNNANANNTISTGNAANNNVAIIANTGNETPEVSDGTLHEVKVSEINTNLQDLASKGRITITVGEEEIDVTPETWGGFGKLFNKDVSYTLIDKSRMAVSLMMENTDTYKVSFYNANSTNANVVIECKKSMTQKLSAEELKSLNSSIDTSKEYTMYIGEVTKAMVR